MHAVLTLLQSLPVTGQLLYASQVAKPVRRILQQQMQLQTQNIRQQGQRQAQGMLEVVVATARLLLRRWKALLAAEVEACDEYRTSKAQQVREVNEALQWLGLKCKVYERVVRHKGSHSDAWYQFEKVWPQAHLV
jgi:hypothetical protein